MGKTFKIVCHFQAMGIKEVEASDLEEAMKLAESEDIAIKADTIRQMGNCRVDAELSRNYVQKENSEAHKEYLNWGSE